MKPARKAGVAVFVALLLAFLALNIVMIGPYLVALLMGAVLAVLSKPLHQRLCRRGLGPKTASFLVVTAMLVLVVGPLAFFATQAVQQGIAVGKGLTQNQPLSVDSLIEKVGRIALVREYYGDAADMTQQLRTMLQRAGAAVTGALLALLTKVPFLLLQTVLALITMFFLLVDGPRFVIWLRDKVPLDRDVQDELSRSYRDTSVSVIWATLAAAATQAVMLFVTFLALGVPAAFLAGGATFVFAWIPVLGSGPVWITGAAILYSQGAIVKMVIMIVAGLLTGVADNLVRPVVLKGRSDMHPLVSLIAIFGGVQMFGLLGVFFGPILMALMLTLVEIWPIIGQRAGWLGGRPRPLILEEPGAASGMLPETASDFGPGSIPPERPTRGTA